MTVRHWKCQGHDNLLTSRKLYRILHEDLKSVLGKIEETLMGGIRERFGCLLLLCVLVSTVVEFECFKCEIENLEPFVSSFHMSRE